MAVSYNLVSTEPAARVNLLIWGEPGVGKTAAVYALGRALNVPVEVVVASIREPTDFLGLPVLHEGEVIYGPPAWAKRLCRARRGILFLDELSTAPPAVQAALFRVVLERVVGELQLPDNVGVIAAANPPDMTPGGWDLSPPLATRFIHIEWELSPTVWAREFIEYWHGSSTSGILGDPAVPMILGLEEIPAKYLREGRRLIGAFLTSRPDLVRKVPDSEALRGRAWPTPRTWDMANTAMAAVLATGRPPTEAARWIAGAVGDGAAFEFLAWLKSFNLPDPEELLSHPDADLPARGDIVLAALSAVVSAVRDNLTLPRWMAGWKVMARAAEQHGADIAAVAARSLAQLRRHDWPLPDEIRAFVPVLKAAKLLP